MKAPRLFPFFQNRVLPAFGLVLATVFSAQHARAQLTAAQKDDIGFTSLSITLGGSMPTGAGVSVTQVEAPESTTNYMPNTAAFTGKSFINVTNTYTTASSHATAVGQYFYGASSLSPAVGASANGDVIRCYEANNWLGSGFLKEGTTSQLPAVETTDIQNHSWVGSTGNTTNDTEILRRFDYAIRRDDFVAVVGLNNGSTPQTLMAGSYNAISVGLSNGGAAEFTTTVDGAGRSKPDIVVPTYATSFATPTVGGAAALVIETARGNVSLAGGDRHEVVKALLMNGATKDEPEFTTTWSHTQTAPLDATYGAGELNVERSYQNLAAGKFAASATTVVGAEGWDYGNAGTVGEQLYFFDVPAGYDATITATLAWDRVVTATDTAPGPLTSYTFTSALANLDLKLYTATAFTKGAMVDQSISSTDNVELIYQTLAAGRYAFGISTDTASTYGFAWKSDLTAIPEPSGAALSLLGLALVMRRRRGRCDR